MVERSFFTAETYTRGNTAYAVAVEALDAVHQVAQDIEDLVIDQLDGVVVTFFQDDPPPDPDHGDLWFDTNDGNKLYRYNGIYGLTARTNAMPNPSPSFSGALGWTGVSGTVAVDATVTFQGRSTLRSVVTDAASPGGLNQRLAWSGNIPVSAGQVWSITMMARSTSVSAITKYGARIVWENASRARLSVSAGAVSTAPGPDNWVLVTATGTAPTGAAFLGIEVGPSEGSEIQAGDAYFVADFLAERTATPGVFFCGGMAGAKWSGAAGSSASTYTPGWELAADQRVAQAILDAAGAQATADGKIRTFYQTYPPPMTNGKDIGDLWVDSDDNNKLYRWDGSDWIGVADVRIQEALNKANAAVPQTLYDQKIAEFNTAITDAQATADGKNTITYATTAGAPAKTGRRAGDLHFVVSASAPFSVSQQWRYNGTDWFAMALTDEVITNLNAAKLTAGFLDTNRLAARSIGVEKLLIGDTGNMATIDPMNPGTAVFGGAVDAPIAGPDGKLWSRRDPDLPPSNGNYFMFRSQIGPVPLQPGDRVRVTFEAYLATGTLSPSVLIWFYPETGGTTATVTLGAVNLTTTPGSFAVEGVVPDNADGAARFLIGLSNAGMTTQAPRVRNVRAYRMGAGELVVDGSITTDMLSLGARELGSNLIVDPSFEADVDMGPYYTDRVQASRQNLGGWSRYATTSSSNATVTKNGAGYRSGSLRLMMTHAANGGNQYIGVVSNVFPVTAGQLYNVSLYAQGSSGNGANLAKLTVTVLFGTAANKIDSVSTARLVMAESVDNVTRAQEYGGNFQVFKDEFAVPAGQSWAALQIEKSTMGTTVFTGTNYLFVDDVAVLKAAEGGAAELTSAGLRLFDSSGDEAAAFVANRPNYLSIKKEGTTVAAISGDGIGTFTKLSISADETDSTLDLDPPTLLGDNYGLEVGGMDLAERLWNLPQGVVAAAWTPAAVTFGQINSEVGLFECAFTAIGGRRYLITASNVQFDSTAAGFISIKLRATTGNVAPTISSALRAEGRGYVDAGGTAGGVDGSVDNVSFFWTPISSGTTICRVLITASRISGGYPWVRVYGVDRALRMLVEDVGPSAEINNGYRVNRGGGNWYSTPPAPIPEPPTTTRYVKYFSSTGWASYGLNTGSSYGVRNPNTGHVYHGRYSGTQGDQFGQYTFSTGLNSASVTIVKAELEITCAGAYYGTGITNVKVRSGTGGLSATYLTSTAKNVGTFTAGQKRTVDITSVFAKSHTKVQIGRSDTTSLSQYGYFNKTARLKITYDQTS